MTTTDARVNMPIGPALPDADERGWHKGETWQEHAAGRAGDDAVGMAGIAFYYKRLDDGTFKTIEECYYVEQFSAWQDDEPQVPIDLTRFELRRFDVDGRAEALVHDRHRPDRRFARFALSGATFGSVPGTEASDEQILRAWLGDEDIFTGQRTIADVGAPGTSTEIVAYRVCLMLMATVCTDHEDPGSTEISGDIEYDTDDSATFTDLDEAEAVCRRKALEDQRFTLV